MNHVDQRLVVVAWIVGSAGAACTRPHDGAAPIEVPAPPTAPSAGAGAGAGAGASRGDAGVDGGAAGGAPAPAAKKVTALDVGSSYLCALLDDGRVACAADVTAMRVVGGLPAADRVHAGDRFGCARARSDRTLWCWGGGEPGRLGGRTTGTADAPPVQVLDAGKKPLVVRDFLVGDGQVCALRERDSAVVCWGSTVSGEAGRPGRHDAKGQWIPVLEPVVVMKNAARLYGGAQTSCAVDAKEALFCWGDQDAGYSGHGATPTPKRVAVPGEVRAMSFASGHSCVLVADGSILCRGWNPGGELGSAGRPQWPMDGSGAQHGDFEPSFVRIPELPGPYVAIAAARHETCAVTREGLVTCIGSPEWMQPLWRRGTRATPQPPRPPSCVIVKEASVPAPRRGSGSAGSGTRGSGSASPSATAPGALAPPAFVPPSGCVVRPEPGFVDVVAISSEMGRRCALDRAGTIRCVGFEAGFGRGAIDDDPAIVALPVE
jgi:hypothetical protein